MNKTIRTLAVVAALAATGYATAASVDAVSATTTSDGIEVLAVTNGANTGAMVCGFKIDPATGTAIPVGMTPVNPDTGTAAITFPLDTDIFRLELRAPGGGVLASVTEVLVELIEQ